MKSTKRFVILLLVNIVVSVIATLAALNYWESQPKVAVQPTAVVTVLVTVPALINPQIEPQPETFLPTPGDTSPILPQATSLPKNYQVQDGDTMSKIAIQFMVGVDDILRMNNLSDPNNIYTGQVLLIPASPLPTYTPDFSPTPYPTATPRPQNTLTPTPTSTKDTSPARVAIESILGANVLDLERVKITHTGGGDASLADWRLTDGDGNSFKFPVLYLYSKGSVTINTKAGINSVLDLYWGLSNPVWQSGEKATLYDAQNNIRSEFFVP